MSSVRQRVALVGQPNSGKSTVFNGLVGYRAVASNFPGTTVEALHGRATLGGSHVDVVDLPGTYSLYSGDRAERVARDYLLSGEVDAVINVLDASLLARSLELTLELAELGIPMVLCLNMMDEAEHKGITIDTEKLGEALGIPVVRTVASRGVGLKDLVNAAARACPATPPSYSTDVENALTSVLEIARDALPQPVATLPPRHLAMQLLGGEAPAPDSIQQSISAIQAPLRSSRGEDVDLILSAERHASAMRLFEDAARVTRAHVSWRERADDIVMHRFLAYPILASVLLGVFVIVFYVGEWLEGLLLPPLEGMSAAIAGALPGVGGQLLAGATEGLWAGIAIVLPFLVPFLILLALLEDVGYLPRVGFLMDTFMHRIGLHGKSVVPLLLGYGCSVPAVMATRILEEDRDRTITAALASMVPCAGRTIVVMGLVARFVGPVVALGLYILNIVVVALVGWALSKLMPGRGPGLILEIPAYRRPALRTVAAKVWLRLREFVRVAWPLLVVSSAALAVIEAFGWTGVLDTGTRFLTWPLGLPAETGVPLVFGVLRKELSLVMLAQALGTTDLGTVLTAAQMIVFTLFLLFYVPCLATVAALGRELGTRRAALVLGGTTGLALVLGLLARAVFALASLP